jgi:hypothetical protein
MIPTFSLNKFGIPQVEVLIGGISRNDRLRFTEHGVLTEVEVLSYERIKSGPSIPVRYTRRLLNSRGDTINQPRVEEFDAIQHDTAEYFYYMQKNGPVEDLMTLNGLTRHLFGTYFLNAQTGSFFQPVFMDAQVEADVITCTVTDGVAPFAYSLDSENWQAENTFAGVPDGSYTVAVRDAQGLVCRETVTVSTTPEQMI